jgi:hypothetical protein
MVHSKQHESQQDVRSSKLKHFQGKTPKPKYETPRVFNLGDIPRGLGQSCNMGSMAQASCVNGLAPKANCVAGAIPPKL